MLLHACGIPLLHSNILILIDATAFTCVVETNGQALKHVHT